MGRNIETPRISLSCKLVPVLYREYENGLLVIRLTSSTTDCIRELHFSHNTKDNQRLASTPTTACRKDNTLNLWNLFCKFMNSENFPISK